MVPDHGGRRGGEGVGVGGQDSGPLTICPKSPVRLGDWSDQLLCNGFTSFHAFIGVKEEFERFIARFKCGGTFLVLMRANYSTQKSCFDVSPPYTHTHT